MSFQWIKALPLSVDGCFHCIFMVGFGQWQRENSQLLKNWKHEGVFGSDLVCIFVVVTNKYDLCKWNHSQYNPLSLSLSGYLMLF